MSLVIDKDDLLKTNCSTCQGKKTCLSVQHEEYTLWICADCLDKVIKLMRTVKN